jgi:hypothetical protein
MMRARFSAVLLLATLGGSAAALAAGGEDHGTGVSVGVTGGTNGLGLEADYRFNNFFALRANTGNYSYSKSVDSGGFGIDGKAKLKSIGVLADFYPFGGSFRISAGLRSNHNKFAGAATPLGSTVDINGTTYTAAQVGTLTGDASFKSTAPTVTLGWGGKFRTGLHFGAEIGVVAQGSPQLSATSSGTLSGNTMFQADLDQRLAQWQHDVKDYKLWPVIQLHLAYRF